MIFKCYFCQTPRSEIDAKNAILNFVCSKCTNNVMRVVMSINPKNYNSLIFVHMMLYRKNSANNYHIRLHLEENYTQIGEFIRPSRWSAIVKIPGLSLNPTNVKEKLPLYLLFS